MNWREFWDRDNAIYVSPRHRQLHYQRIAQGIVALIEAPDWCVLDYGSGEAINADLVAGRCARLYLFDAAPSVQARQRDLFRDDHRIRVLDQAGVDGLPEASLDLVVANSLLQYLSRDEFQALLDLWHRKLKAGGKLAIADVISNDATAAEDVFALLSFGWRGGFLARACCGLVSTFFSDYRKLRMQIGLTRYSADDILSLLTMHGFVEARRATPNIGHNQNRMMFVARRGA